MLDLGWQEFVMVGLVLILVVGPKDMPRILKAVVKTIGKVRGMAREFQSSMMEVADQDEFKDVKKALNDVRTGQVDALAEFEKAKESVNTSYVPGFSSGVQEIKEEAEGLKKDVEAVKTEAETTSKPAAKPKAKRQLKPNQPKKLKQKRNHDH